MTPLEQLELVGRLLLAAALAGVLGWERQLGQQPSGMAKPMGLQRQQRQRPGRQHLH